MLTTAHITGEEPITGGTLRLLIALIVVCAIGIAATVALSTLTDLNPVILGPHLQDMVAV